jgi:hypothetical protein
MSQFYVRWHINPRTTPTDPGERVSLWMKMLEEVKGDLKVLLDNVYK